MARRLGPSPHIDHDDIRRSTLVAVEWRDAVSAAGWKDGAKAVAARGQMTPMCISVGFLTRSTPHEVTVAQNLSTTGEIGDLITIPRGMVRKIVRLKLPL